MHMELLQRDLKLSDRDKLQEKARAEVTGKNGIAALAESKCRIVEIDAWEQCIADKTPKKFQVTSEKFKHANLSRWEKEKKWETVIQLDASMTEADTDKKFRNINSCAINPVDNTLYCSVQMEEGSFLIKIGNETATKKMTLGFLAKLRQWRWAATFDEADNYYVYGEEDSELGTLNVIEKVSLMPAFASYRCDGVQTKNFDHDDKRVEVNVAGKGMTKKMHLGADFVYMNISKDEVYLAALAGKDFNLRKISENPFQLFTVNTSGLPDPTIEQPPYTRVWGTAWSHKQLKNSTHEEGTNLYFSGDDGRGVYALSTHNLNIGGVTTFFHHGEAPETDWNDGFSCGDDGNIIKSDCTAGLMYRSSTKNRLKPGSKPESEICVVNEVTGENKNCWKVDVKDEKLAGINACAMNPKDDLIYCVLRFTEPNKNFIARLDTTGTVGYVTRLEGDWVISGVFDDNGIFYFYEAEFGLHQIKDIHTFKPTSAYAHKEIWPKKTRVGKAKYKVGADFAILEHDDDVYLASIMMSAWYYSEQQGKWLFPRQRASLIKITGGNLADDVTFLYEEGEVLPKPKDSEEIRAAGIKTKEITYGTAWKSVGNKGEKKEILFADDSGQGVWKLLPNVSIKDGTVQFEKKRKYYLLMTVGKESGSCFPTCQSKTGLSNSRKRKTWSITSESGMTASCVIQT